MNASNPNNRTPPLPYQARLLTPKEVREGDIYSFRSPKGGRLLRVHGLPNLILALRLEFDPMVDSYVERPRLLRFEQQLYEFAFWYRTRAGLERMPLLVYTRDSVPAEPHRRSHRKAVQLLAAAEEAHLPLQFEFEADLLKEKIELANRLRLLPGVQLAQRFPNRAALRERIMNTARTLRRCRISQVVDALCDFSAADVRCTICDLVHSGTLSVNIHEAVTQHSIIEVTDHEP